MGVLGVQHGGSLRFWGTRLLVMAGAVVLGLWLQQVLGARLATIQEHAAHDVVAARGELASLLRIVGGLVFGGTALVGVAMTLASRRALAAGAFPPPGLWSWGSTRTVTGPRARTLARVWLLLAILVTVLSVTGLGLVFHAARMLLSCKAG